MVLDGTRSRGATEDPDKVLASPARWAVLALFAFVCTAGVAMALGGAFGPLGAGETRSVAAVLAGVQFAVAGAAGVVVLMAPGRLPRRGPLPAAHTVDGGVELPVRASHRVARGTAMVVLGSSGLTVLALADSAAGKALGVAVAVVGVVFAMLTARATGTIRLDPAGVTLPAGVTPSEHIAWRDVVEVAVTGGWQPMLVMTWKGPGLSACRILSQAWPPSALVAVIEHYRSHPADRAGLVDSTSLEQFPVR